MEIQKIGHCCLVIDIEGTRIMTDPGTLTKGQFNVDGLDGIIITHTHPDHIDLETVHKVFSNNPDAKIICNSDVAQLLKEKHSLNNLEVLDEGESSIQSVSVRAIPNNHAHIYEGVDLPKNTGYFIEEMLYIPGDSYDVPNVKVEVLALPVAAPWGTIGDAINFAKAVHPVSCFPIHDGMNKVYGPWHRWPLEILQKEGIAFLPMEEDHTAEF